MENAANNNENDGTEHENDKETTAHEGDKELRVSVHRSRRSIDRSWSRDRDSPDDGKSDKVELTIDEDVVDGKAAQKQSNTYAAKKTVAQGMMDIALITANANQLRFILEFNRQSSTFYLNVGLITVSLILQVAVGVSLIFKGRLDLKGQSKHRSAKMINNYMVVGVFLVTIINVFIASFTITNSNASNVGPVDGGLVAARAVPPAPLV